MAEGRVLLASGERNRDLMRALIVSPVFPPEPIVSALTTADIANGLQLRGHEVAVITAFPSRPAGRVYAGYSRRVLRKEMGAKGYQVIRCGGFLSGHSRMLSRFAENVTFGISSGVAATLTRRPDVIYANTWPIVAAGVLATVAKWRGVPLVTSVQDVYPESLISQGRIAPSGLLVSMLRRIDRTVAERSHSVIVISEQLAEIYRADRAVPVDRVHTVANWVDEHTIVPNSGGAEIRSETGIPRGAFLLAYGGNIGVAAGVECVIKALGELPSADRPYFLIAGAGPRLSECRAVAAQIAPARVVIYSPWPAEKTSGVYAAADVLVLPTRGDQSLASQPSKLIAYMLSARPIIAQAVHGSDLANTIEAAGCGWVVAPDSPNSLAKTIDLTRKLTPDDLRRRGQSGRLYALRHMTQAVCLPRVLDIIERAAQWGR